MPEKGELDDFDIDSMARRRVPCLVAYLHPFRLVNAPNSPAWDVSIDEVNQSAWDYIALHEVVGALDVGLDAPYNMVVCRDGAVAVPPLPGLRDDQQSVEFFNRCLAALLIGGIYCEAIALDSLDFGSIIDWKYLRVHSKAPAASNSFHRHVRLRQATPLEAISLLAPRSVTLKELSAAIDVGRKVLNSVPEVSGEFLLKGVTGIARRDWGSALANLWIVVEQITTHMWTGQVLTAARQSKKITGRVEQLSDSRTWTIAARHELLHQIGVLSHGVLEHLSNARKARNDLSHKGKHPPASAARSAYVATIDLLKIAAQSDSLPMLDIDLRNHQISDPFRPIEPEKIEPTYWMEIPKLPGELELERLEAKHIRPHRSKTDSP